jgi:hypothetical protein
VSRNLLTAEYVDGVERPATGELWIADTEIRGFGLRVWASDTSDFKAFAVRKNDRSGRTIRRSFQPWRDGYHWHENWDNPEGKLPYDEHGRTRLGFFIKAARRWARRELDIIAGKKLSDQARAVLDDEYNQMSDHSGAQLSDRTLGHLVDVTLRYGELRGWSESYRDRLRHVFDQFDPDDKIRSARVGDLADGKLAEFIQGYSMPPDNLRLLRSLLKVVLWNVHELGGPAFGQMLPGGFYIPTRRHFYDDRMEQYLSTRKLDDLLGWLRQSKVNWRARSAIALACLFWAPCSRVFRAQWTEIVDNRWLPYGPGERRYWWAKWSRIDEEAYCWLLLAREGANSEGVHSDFWFPRKSAPDYPTVNVDHVWFAAMQDLQWRYTTLAEYSARARRWQIGLQLPDKEKQAEIAAILSSWPGTRTSVKEGR